MPEALAKWLFFVLLSYYKYCHNSKALMSVRRNFILHLKSPLLLHTIPFRLNTIYFPRIDCPPPLKLRGPSYMSTIYRAHIVGLLGLTPQGDFFTSFNFLHNKHPIAFAGRSITLIESAILLAMHSTMPADTIHRHFLNPIRCSHY